MCCSARTHCGVLHECSHCSRHITAVSLTHMRPRMNPWPCGAPLNTGLILPIVSSTKTHGLAMNYANPVYCSVRLSRLRSYANCEIRVAAPLNSWSPSARPAVLQRQHEPAHGPHGLDSELACSCEQPPWLSMRKIAARDSSSIR